MRAKPPTTCRIARIAAALLAMAAALPIAPSWAQGANDDTKAVAADPEDAAYWLRNREGWFWYRDPPAAARRPAPPAPKPPTIFGRRFLACPCGSFPRSLFGKRLGKKMTNPGRSAYKTSQPFSFLWS